MLHLHGEKIYFDLTKEYPVHVVNWHDRDTPPSLSDAQKTFKGTVCGGISRETLVYKTATEIRQEADDAMLQTKGKRFILSTGCVVPIIAPQGNWTAARKTVERS